MGFTQKFLGKGVGLINFPVPLALLEAHPSDHWMFSDALPLTERRSIICSVLS